MEAIEKYTPRDRTRRAIEAAARMYWTATETGGHRYTWAEIAAALRREGLIRRSALSIKSLPREYPRLWAAAAEAARAVM